MLAFFLALQVTAAFPQTVPLAAPERTLDIDFTQIRAVRELPDGRVIITDRLDKGVVVADFNRNTFTPIGRTGSGPAEYRMPTALSPMPGDSTLLSDEGNERMAVIGPDLRIHRTFNLMLPGIGIPLGARSVDRQGRYILQIPGWVLRKSGDTVLVIRYDARTQKIDTLARVKGSTPRRNTQVEGLPYVIFAAQDVWNVTPDGRVGVVRSNDYHIEWHDADGRVTTGPRIPFESRPVTMEERVAHVRRFMENSSTSSRDGTTGLSPLPAKLLEDRSIRRVTGTQEHATEHPPFTEATPHVGPDGSFWVSRSMPLGSPQTWDVIGSSGALTGRVQMPKERRLVSIGPRWLYAVVTDDDGLQRLERYAHPSFSPRR